MKLARIFAVALCLISFAALCPMQSAEAQIFGSARARVARAKARGDARVARAQAFGGPVVVRQGFHHFGVIGPQRVIVNQGFGARVLVLP